MTIEFNRQRFIYSIQSRLDQSSLFGLLCLCLITILIMQHSSAVNVIGIGDGRTQWIGAGMTPNGLTPLEWEGIQAQIAAKPYQVTAAASGGFTADNPANQWQTTYGADGSTHLSSLGKTDTTWEWGLKLTDYGYGNGQEASRPLALINDGQTLTYQWDENLSEWWVNSSEGLEQGFTLLERPQFSVSNTPLVLEMNVIGNLVPVVVGETIQLQRENGETVLTYDKLHVIDSNGQTVPADFTVFSQGGAYQIHITANDADAVYPLTIDPTVQQAYVKASNTDPNDNFGRSVAVSGNTVVVGANFEDSNATGVNGDDTDDSEADSGAAYVFVRSGGVWSQQAYLKAFNTGTLDWFGYEVAISGDIIVVGAPFEDSDSTGVNGADNDSASNAGAAYIYTRTGTTWSYSDYLKASNTEMNDRFGIAVAVSGETIVVGALGEDSNSTGVNNDDTNNDAVDSGAAYVFTRSSGTWSQQAYLKASNTGMGDNFGITVAISADTIVVGANGEDSNSTGVNGADNDLGTDTGAAYVFTRSGAVWSQQAYLKASNTGDGDVFGNYVGVSGDTAVVAAAGEASNATGINGDETDDSMPGAGATYVFTRSGGTWNQEAYLKASNTDGGDNFGTSLSVSGNRIIVGAWLEDSAASGINGNGANNTGTDSGAAYLFVRSSGTWSQQSYIKASNRGNGDFFGGSVAISGDTAVAGATREDSSATGINGSQAGGAANSGAAYIFRESFCSNQSGNWNATSTWVGGVVPGGSDAACISIGDTVTLDVAAAVDSLTVYPNAALDLGTFNFTAETSVINHGTLFQTMTVNNAVVNFLQIQNAGATTTHYRGVTIDTTTNMQDLGSVEVEVRETINWLTLLDVSGKNILQYCTSEEAFSATYAQRCFRINPTMQPVSDVTVRLWGLTSELNGIAEGNLAVFRHIGGPGSQLWLELTTNASTGNDGGNYSYAEGDTSGFSSFLLGETGNNPTAVSLLSSTINNPTPFIVLTIALLLAVITLFSWYTRKKETDR